ncbi:hypothetical protein [Listeria sp. ILCC810]|nr:hypothetical protein [Listeria sp. ILCC810]
MVEHRGALNLPTYNDLVDAVQLDVDEYVSVNTKAIIDYILE